MRVELLPRGVGHGEPIVLDATLVLVTHDDGKPIIVAGVYGPDGVVRAAHTLDKDFEQVMHALGLSRPVICDQLVLPPPPPGAVLIRKPG